MNSSQIEEIATGLAEREAAARVAKREASRVAAEETQRESAAADVARIAKVRDDWRSLGEREKALKAELESRRLPGTSVFIGPPNEIAELRCSHARLLQERAQMIRRHPFLEREAFL